MHAHDLMARFGEPDRHVASEGSLTKHCNP
jgi:hypothetical protein